MCICYELVKSLCPSTALDSSATPLTSSLDPGRPSELISVLFYSTLPLLEISTLVCISVRLSYSFL